MRRRGPPRRIAAATVTHIPFLEGFYAQSLDILRLSLASLRDHADEELDLWVFDNGSCPEARAFLLEEAAQGRVDRLILSGENVGILGAHNVLFSAIPNEIIAYADSDVYFHPGWLRACLTVLEAFPNAGLVTGVPVRSAAAEAVHSGLAWAASASAVQHETGHLIPPEWIADFCVGTGRETQRYLEEWQAQTDHRLTYAGVTAYAGASPFQFVGRKAALASALPLHDDWLLRAGEFLARMDAAGYLLLATNGLYVHHLGNTLTPEWRAVAERHGTRPSARPLAGGPGARLAAQPLARRVLLRLYDYLFRLLYGGGQ
jgi:glycosyltransferase involved in cell wall biosynthesis